MASYQIVKLYFTSPLHIGKGLGDHYDSAGNLLHSDTISGAIASAYCHIYGDELLSDFMESYRVSSAFPFVPSDIFVPKPQIKFKTLQFKGGNTYVQNKRLKKVEFIDRVLFSKLAQGNVVEIEEGQLSENGKFLYSGKDQIQPYRDEVMQRVVVPRMGGDATPFYFERRFFDSGCGLYFFYKVNSEFEKSFASALHWLSQTGFGTDKSVGNGLFEVEFSTTEFPDIVKAKRTMILSLLCPQKEEINGEMLNESNYSLVQRGGFIAGTTIDSFRHLRKKSIYMFTEGSLFNSNTLVGKIENVRPTWNDDQLHPVYRDGRAFCLPVNF